MEKRQPLFFETLFDPFAVLKVCRLLQEIPNGEFLELLVKGEEIPCDLQKILAPEQYQITVGKSILQAGHTSVVIEKRKLSGADVIRKSHTGGCCR